MKNGFTLTELLVYIAVLAIILVAVAVLFFWIISSANKTQATQEVLDNIKIALEVVSYEGRMADEVYDPASIFNTNPGQLSLKTTNSLPAGESFTYVDFYLCNNRICIKRESQNPIAITSDKVTITNFAFKKLVASGMTSIVIEVEARYNNPGNRPDFNAMVSASSTVALRKY